MYRIEILVNISFKYIIYIYGREILVNISVKYIIYV